MALGRVAGGRGGSWDHPAATRAPGLAASQLPGQPEGEASSWRKTAAAWEDRDLLIPEMFLMYQSDMSALISRTLRPVAGAYKLL